MIAGERVRLRALERDDLPRSARIFAIDAQTADGWAHIGSTGFHDVDWRCRHAEFGIMIGDKDFWSRGYGADAVKTLVGFGFGELNLWEKSKA